MSDLRTIILAAGKGSRMKSETPKVLHPVCGKPIVEYVIDIANHLRSLKTYLVVGHGAALVEKTIGNSVEYVLQPQLLGTADALRRVKPKLAGYKGTVLVMCGDTPLLSRELVKQLVAQHKRTKASASVLSARLGDPTGYGRIIRSVSGEFTAIREQKDASEEEAAINEINVGVYCFQAPEVFKVLGRIKLNPAKQEFYLTDVIALLLADGKKVATLTTDDESCAFGVNSRVDLAQAYQVLRARIINEHLANGVTVVDPTSTHIEAGVKIGQDTVIYPFSVVHASAKIGRDCKIGPFARIRPGSVIGDQAEIGNFAEVSRSTVGKKTMMKHFSFLGDAKVGSKVNIGAGTITANYDGKSKNTTTIGDGAFIGSDTVLVAPVAVGKKAMIGAASLVARGKNIPAGSTAYGAPAKVIRK